MPAALGKLCAQADKEEHGWEPGGQVRSSLVGAVGAAVFQASLPCWYGPFSGFQSMIIGTGVRGSFDADVFSEREHIYDIYDYDVIL